jgi:hypothetical protein
MATSRTTLKQGASLPPRGLSNKNRILQAMREESFESLKTTSTKDECEIAFFKCIVKRAANPDDKDSAMMLKFLGDKGWNNLKPMLDPIEFEFPVNGTPKDKAFSIVEAIASGAISADVGQIIIGIIKDAVIIEEGTDLKLRIEELEKKLGLTNV